MQIERKVTRKVLLLAQLLVMQIVFLVFDPHFMFQLQILLQVDRCLEGELIVKIEKDYYVVIVLSVLGLLLLIQ